MDYLYENIATEPDLTGIHTDVEASAMTDKNIEGCRWDEEPETLLVVWQDELSAGDKTILDGIVASHT
jgi:hypothetical protein